MMTRDEYEERKRLIEAQHRATIELIEAGRQAQHRALDLVWLTGGVEGVPLQPRAEVSALGSPVQLLEAASSETVPPALAAAPSSAPAKRRGIYGLLNQIESVLDQLPELFDYHDLVRALGVELDRGAVRRNLKLLVEEEILALESSTSGRFRHRYRKLGGQVPPETD